MEPVLKKWGSLKCKRFMFSKENYTIHIWDNAVNKYATAKISKSRAETINQFKIWRFIENLNLMAVLWILWKNTV